jgi:hypothetical protein
MTTRTTTRKTKRGFDGGKEDDGNNGNNAKKRTVAELKSELSKRELPTDGVKRRPVEQIGEGFERRRSSRRREKEWDDEE